MSGDHDGADDGAVTREFAAVARRLEADLAVRTRDLRRPPRPRPAVAVGTTLLVGVVTLLATGATTTVAWCGLGLVVALVALIALALRVARDWVHAPTD